MLSEMAGRIILKAAFEAQGYSIIENYPFALGELKVVLDGYDPQARVGYEYVTQEDGIAPGPLDLLMQHKACHLFLIDENEVADAQTMLAAVVEFFRQIESHV